MIISHKIGFSQKNRIFSQKKSDFSPIFLRKKFDFFPQNRIYPKNRIYSQKNPVFSQKNRILLEKIDISSTPQCLPPLIHLRMHPFFKPSISYFKVMADFWHTDPKCFLFGVCFVINIILEPHEY
jgi:hypothetical protein